MALARPNVGHVGLNVTDVDRSIGFYRQVFGFEVLAEGKEDGRRFAFLGTADRLVITLWQQAEDASDPSRAGLHHLSFQVDTVDEVRAAEATLRDLAVTFRYDGVVPHGEGADSGGIFFFDPDGIRLEIFAPSGAGAADAPTAGAPTCGFF
ncbi:VOC family protein [Saccharothrix violaceirubra]|uniref:Catechol 2,3-dioxygenase-like lactoylglutathione lyase family enzyme n=1 Tax=Saccharothrix violaceirubra TaxID=413306 RepID=A0A7W7WVB9_9PSEU|nr:VOC family protein [Saccharothrix violaceirubra]MBB4964757.1 catechol 2,3-dioxygenase-like lactoylglutathione lyase family enzyme [Saccharothrix violaceirubra]